MRRLDPRRRQKETHTCDGCRVKPGNDNEARGSAVPDQASTKDIEEGRTLAPRFDSQGLVTCVATDVRTGEVLMVAHMNAEALQRTIETGEAWYFSRSRRSLWKKGERSGHVQRVREMRIDCDQDAIWIKVEQLGAGACHTGRRTCFYRAVPLRGQGATLEFRDAETTFDPQAVYDKSS
jgi:phosphoribosyl-AMP cyclohydrolase